MKILKNLIASVLAVMLIFTMAMPVFAEGETNGTITIKNALPDTDYKIYKIFDLTLGSESEPQSYAYTYNTLTASHETDFLTALINDSPFDLVEIPTDSGIYEVTLKQGKKASDIMIFFKAQASNLKAVDNEGVWDESEKTFTFTDLEYAYYYVATESGAAMGIDTIAQDATIEEKSQRPGPVDGVYKAFVNENGDVILGDDGLPIDTNTANCGDVINYVLQIQTRNYSEGKRIMGYVVLDSLGKGLTDFKITKITVDDIIISETIVKTVDPENDQYGSATEIQILWVDDSMKDHIYEDGAILKIYCEATLTVEAMTGPIDQQSFGDYNKNKVKFSWVYDNGETEDGEEHKVATRTYAIGILKTSDKFLYGGPNLLPDEISGVEHLEGAEFELTYEDGNKVPLKEVEREYGVLWYVYDKEGTVTTIKNNSWGEIFIMGLDGDKTYILTETKAPPGYNLLKESKKITPEDFINEIDYGVYYSWDENGNILKSDGQQWPSNGAYFNKMCVPWHVINEAGIELPSTGGIGTTIFYVLGGLLVVCAGVFFITRRRMRTKR